MQSVQSSLKAVQSVWFQRNPRSILSHENNANTSLSNTFNKFQALASTVPETDSIHKERKSPADEPHQLRLLISANGKMGRLIMTQVKGKRVDCPSENLERIIQPDINELKVKKGEGAVILKKCGLEKVKVHPNGNCQNYCVAIALLNHECNKPGDTKLLETLTRKLKKGIATEANHFFVEEFPHSNRVQQSKTKKN